jgi:hypothetical protein
VSDLRGALLPTLSACEQLFNKLFKRVVEQCDDVEIFVSPLAHRIKSFFNFVLWMFRPALFATEMKTSGGRTGMEYNRTLEKGETKLILLNSGSSLMTALP